jgi:hypothetical protein
MDRPMSLLTSPPLQYLLGLGFAAWMLGHRVGMDASESVWFAIIFALSVRGLISYAVNAGK